MTINKIQFVIKYPSKKKSPDPDGFTWECCQKFYQNSTHSLPENRKMNTFQYQNKSRQYKQKKKKKKTTGQYPQDSIILFDDKKFDSQRIC